MKKVISLIFTSFVVVCSFTSCRKIFENVFFEETFDEPNKIFLDDVKNKTTYKSFEQLKDPIVFPMPVYEDNWANAGSVFVIYDTQTDQIHDWVFSNKTVSYYYPVEVQSDANSNVCYFGMDDSHREISVIEPAKTEPYFYHQIRDGNSYSYSSILPYKTKNILLTGSSYVYTEEDSFEGVLFNVINSSNGTFGKTIGCKMAIDDNHFFPDEESNYWFTVKFEEDLSLCKLNTATNEIEDSGLFYVDLRALSDSLGLTKPFDPESFDPEDFAPDDFSDEFNNNFVHYNVFYVDSSYIYIYESVNDIENKQGYQNLYRVDRKTGEQKVMKLEYPDPDVYFAASIDSVIKWNDKLLFVEYINKLAEDYTTSYICFWEVDFENMTQKKYGDDILSNSNYIRQSYLRGDKIYFFLYEWDTESTNMLVYNLKENKTVQTQSFGKTSIVQD